jgi:hypothetical protein
MLAGRADQGAGQTELMIPLAIALVLAQLDTRAAYLII